MTTDDQQNAAANMPPPSTLESVRRFWDVANGIAGCDERRQAWTPASGACSRYG